MLAATPVVFWLFFEAPGIASEPTAIPDHDHPSLTCQIRALEGVALFFGLGTAVGVWPITQWARKRMQAAIDKAIYKVDPTLRHVYIPAEGFDMERARLAWLGFTDIRTYTHIEQAGPTGLVVVRGDDLDQLLALLAKSEHDPNAVGYVLYTRRQIDNPERLEPYPNTTFSNTPATLGQALFVLGRGLTR